MDKKGQHYSNKKNNSVNKLLIVLICVLGAAVLALTVIFVVLPLTNGEKAGAAGWFDSSAQEGDLPGKTPEEIQAELNRVVEEGMFNISIASIIVFKDGAGDGAARIENIPSNRYHMSVSITLDDTGEIIYESKGIQPGQFIENIRLSKVLEKGEYSATALFTAYNKDDLSEEGQAAARITILVEK